ncbi:hypothetical protein BJ138DRAFT_1148499 [Hygrophoropsis aurantiaca]|uniref:Uncharacterized protein n=1 Tax=Hygrophoropsis aurantiaca TaxID=72124 RepID=A0ACB8AGH6_9AGAM|nr:hypothetical protein BJ138DRAFT_1148499 [Hygrophoropsis aurantiaca]
MVDANATIGALEIGSLVMTFALGIVTIQTYHYYRRYPNDPAWLKTLVAVVLLSAIVHTITVLAGMYDVSVIEFGQVAAELLTPLPTGLSGSILLSGLLAPLVQAYFAYRVYVVSAHIYMPMVCWTFSLSRFVGSMALAAFAFKVPSLETFGASYGWLLTTVLVLGAVNDTLIAGNMCYYLKSERDFTLRMGRSAKPLDRMIAYTIETGFLTSLTAILIMICFLSLPDNFTWIAFYFFFGEIFANTLLASLNARRVQTDANETVVNLTRTTHLPNDSLSTIARPMNRSDGSRRIRFGGARFFISNGNMDKSNPPQNPFVYPNTVPSPPLTIDVSKSHDLKGSQV